METEITSDWIDRYNEDELSETEKSLFQERMLTNPLLRSEVYIDACLNRLLAEEEVLDLMGKIRSASMKNISGNRRMNFLLVAASILCFVMIGGLFYLVRTNMAPDTVCSMHRKNQFYQTNGADPTKLHCPSDFEQSGHNVSLPFCRSTYQRLMAKNFEPLSEFELLIGSVTRSHPFKLISPGVNDSISAGTEVLFAWQEYNQAIPISIIIMNNQGIPVYEISLNQTSSYHLKTNGYRAGLYYWKIIMNDDMVLMGKLTIL
jgi:hypothetical protein